MKRVHINGALSCALQEAGREILREPLEYHQQHWDRCIVSYAARVTHNMHSNSSFVIDSERMFIKMLGTDMFGGLEQDEAWRISNRLAYVNQWPEEMFFAWCNISDYLCRPNCSEESRLQLREIQARLAVRRINHLIEMGN